MSVVKHNKRRTELECALEVRQNLYTTNKTAPTLIAQALISSVPVLLNLPIPKAGHLS